MCSWRRLVDRCLTHALYVFSREKLETPRAQEAKLGQCEHRDTSLLRFYLLFLFPSFFLLLFFDCQLFFDGRGGRCTAFSRWGSFQFRNYVIWTRVRLTRAVVRAVEVCCFVFCVWVCVCAVLPVRCRATKERVVIHKAAYITVHSRAAEIKLERLPIWCFGFDLVGASASFRGWKEQNDLACLPQTTRPPRQWPFWSVSVFAENENTDIRGFPRPWKGFNTCSQSPWNKQEWAEKVQQWSYRNQTLDDSVVTNL